MLQVPRQARLERAGPAMTDAPLHYPAANDTAGVVVPSHPLSRRIRGWLTWALIFALLAWAWAPAEMFRVVALFTDWRGAVRRRISQAQFPRLGPLSQRHDRNGPDRHLGYGAGRTVRHPILDPEREQYLPAVDRAADPAADGRLPRHQRDRVRADVRRCGRPRSLRRRHGDFRSQSRCVFQALFRSGRSDRPAPGRRYPGNRRARVARGRLRRRAPGDAAVELTYALPARD